MSGVASFQLAISQESQDEGPVTVVTKDNKQYYQVRYQFRDNGLLLLNSEGMTVVPYDQLPDDLSEFPKNEQEFIKSKQTPSPPAPIDESVISFTTKSGLKMDNVSYTLGQSGIVVHTHSSGDVTLAYDQIDLTSLRVDVQLRIAKIRQTTAADAKSAFPTKISVTTDVIPTSIKATVPIDSHMYVEGVTVKAGTVLTPIGIKDNSYIVPILIRKSQRVAEPLHTGTQVYSTQSVPAISTDDLQDHSHMVDTTQEVEGTGLIPIDQTKVSAETNNPQIAQNNSELSTTPNTNTPSSSTPEQVQSAMSQLSSSEDGQSLFKNHRTVVQDLLSGGCTFERDIRQVPDLPHYKLEKISFQYAAVTPIRIQLGLLNGEIVSAYLEEDFHKEVVSSIKVMSNHNLLPVFFEILTKILKSPVPQDEMLFLDHIFSDNNSQTGDNISGRVVSSTNEIKIEQGCRIEICTAEASPLEEIRQLSALTAISTGSQVWALEPTPTGFTIGANNRTILFNNKELPDFEDALAQWPTLHEQLKARVDPHQPNYLDATLQQINSSYSISGDGNRLVYMNNPEKTFPQNSWFYFDNDYRYMALLHWVFTNLPSKLQDMELFDKNHSAAEVAYQNEYSGQIQEANEQGGSANNISWQENLDTSATLPISSHDKDVQDKKKQLKDMASAYGSYYSIEIVRKLQNQDFKGLAGPDSDIYDVIVTGLSPIQYRQRDIATNNTVDNQPIRLSGLSFMQYQHTEALLVTTQTSFTSTGKAEILCHQGDKASVTMGNGFDAEVPVLFEAPVDAQTENKIVEIEDELSKNK